MITFTALLHREDEQIDMTQMLHQNQQNSLSNLPRIWKTAVDSNVGNVAGVK